MAAATTTSGVNHEGLAARSLWEPLGVLGVIPEPYLCNFGGLRGPYGVMLGVFLGFPGALLGHTWGPWGPSWRPSIKSGGSPISGPPSDADKSRLGALLGRSWGALGSVLEPSWAPLGAILGHLGAILRPLRAHRRRKSEKAKNIVFL